MEPEEDSGETFCVIILLVFYIIYALTSYECNMTFLNALFIFMYVHWYFVRLSDPLEVELQAVVSSHAGVGN